MTPASWWSSPARGTWVEILPDGSINVQIFASSPARGTWVEILILAGRFNRVQRRLPHGGRGLKSAGELPAAVGGEGRLPHGGRGLKYGGCLGAGGAESVVSRTGDVG